MFILFRFQFFQSTTIASVTRILGTLHGFVYAHDSITDGECHENICQYELNHASINMQTKDSSS